MAERVTVAVLDQKIEDHLGDCVRTRTAIFERLGKIDSLLSKIALMIIAALASAVLALGGEIYRLQTARPAPAATVNVQSVSAPPTR